MMEFFTALYHVVVGLLFIGILGAGFLIALGLMSMVFRHLGKGKKQVGLKKDLFQVHQTTVYDRRASIKKRLYDEQVAATRKSRGGAAVGGAKVDHGAFLEVGGRWIVLRPDQRPTALARHRNSGRSAVPPARPVDPSGQSVPRGYPPHVGASRPCIAPVRAGAGSARSWNTWPQRGQLRELARCTSAWENTWLQAGLGHGN